jgi:hypothetical protein
MVKQVKQKCMNPDGVEKSRFHGSQFTVTGEVLNDTAISCLSPAKIEDISN